MILSVDHPCPSAIARLRQVAVVLIAVAVLTGCGGGGGGGGGTTAPATPVPTLGAVNLAVLIAEGDATSEAIALAYQRARGIPDANLIRLSVPRGSDSARSVRYPDFQALAGSGAGSVVMRYVDNAAGAASDVVNNQSGVMFYFTGLASVPQMATNTYLPGAVADHLTSLGAAFGGASGQTQATD